MSQTPARYAILLSDLQRRGDQVVGYEHTKDRARAAVRELNAAILAARGEPKPGRPVPLYYTCLTSSC